MSDLVSVSIQGQTFINNAPVTDPIGPYVEHSGRIYPARSGYPLQVLLDLAGETGQLILVNCEKNGVVAALAGTNRVVYFKRDEDNRETMYIALLRMHLASTSFMPVSIGRFDDMPCVEIDLDQLKLPKIIYPVKTLQGVLSVIALFIACGLGSFTSLNYMNTAALQVTNDAADMKHQMNEALQQVSVLKDKINQRSKGMNAESNSWQEEGEMPEPIHSYTEPKETSSAEPPPPISSGSVSAAASSSTTAKVNDVLERIERGLRNTPESDAALEQAITRQMNLLQSTDKALRPIGYVSVGTHKYILISRDGRTVTRLREGSAMGPIKVTRIDEDGVNYQVGEKDLFSPLSFQTSDPPKPPPQTSSGGFSSGASGAATAVVGSGGITSSVR